MAKSTFGAAVQQAQKSDTRSTFRDPSVGKHTASVASGDVLPLAKDPNQFRLRLRFVVDSGPDVGASTFASQQLRPGDDTNVRIFAGMAAALGVDPVEELGQFEFPDPDEDTPEAAGEKVKAILEYVREKAVGQRVEIVVKASSGNREGVEAKFVNPLPEGSAPSQLDQAKQGAAAMASAIGKPAKATPAGPKKPGSSRPSI